MPAFRTAARRVYFLAGRTPAARCDFYPRAEIGEELASASQFATERGGRSPPAVPPLYRPNLVHAPGLAPHQRLEERRRSFLFLLNRQPSQCVPIRLVQRQDKGLSINQDGSLRVHAQDGVYLIQSKHARMAASSLGLSQRDWKTGIGQTWRILRNFMGIVRARIVGSVPDCNIGPSKRRKGRH